MSRTPIRDVPFNQPGCQLSTDETCRIVDRWPMPERENVARGLVPRWGRGGARLNPPCRFAVPNHNSRSSYLGVPAAAGVSDWYENSYPLPPNSSFSRKRESRGEGWHQPHPNTSNDQVSFSYLGVPAPAGMSDWYESMSRTPMRDVPSNQPGCRLSTDETCRIVDRWPMA